MMRVGIISYDFFPSIGGQGVEAYELYRALSEDPRIHVEVFSAGKNSLENHTRIPSVDYSGLGQLFFSLLVNPVARRLAGRRGLDIMQVYGGPGGVLMLKKPGIPLLYVANHTYAQQSEFLRRPVYRALKRIEGYGYGMADMIVAISSTTADSLVKDYGIDPRIVATIPVGIDTDVFKPLEIERVPGSILFVGRLCKRKGVPLLIDALKVVNKSIPEAKLFIVGDGGMKTTLEEKVRRDRMDKSVEFLGRLSQEELVRWYNRVEVFVLPSLFEGFGIACLEAMSCGTPVVASRAPGLIDVVSDGKTGILSERSPDSLAHCIQKILEDKDFSLELGLAGRNKALERFSWKDIEKEFVEVYYRVIQGNRPDYTGVMN